MEIGAAEVRIVGGDFMERSSLGDDARDVRERDARSGEHRLAAHDGRIADDAFQSAVKLPITGDDTHAPRHRQRLDHFFQCSAHGRDV